MGTYKFSAETFHRIHDADLLEVWVALCNFRSVNKYLRLERYTKLTPVDIRLIHSRNALQPLESHSIRNQGLDTSQTRSCNRYAFHIRAFLDEQC